MSRSRNSNPDHTRRHNMPAPSNLRVEAHLSDLLSPPGYKQLNSSTPVGIACAVFPTHKIFFAFNSIFEEASTLYRFSTR